MAPWKSNRRSLGDQDDGEPRTLKESRRQRLTCLWSWPSGGYWKFWLEEFLASWKKVVSVSVFNSGDI